MASSEAAAPSCDSPQAKTTQQTLKEPPATKSLETRAFAFTIRAYFPTPVEPTRFNPVTAMNQLFRTMLKDEPSLVLCNLANDQQVVLASTPLPTGKTEFHKYYNVSTTRIDTQNKTNVCIGCNLLSNRTLGSIKHRSTSNHLLAWIKKERIFVESDRLGTERPRTVGYFTNIAPDITHLQNFQDHLANQLMMIEVDAATAVELAPHLKDQQLEAMSNGDDYIPILPPFQVYRTRLTHGQVPLQVTMDVIGIKCAPQDAKLLGEFFTRLASITSNHHDGIFVPKGAAYLLGVTTYKQILKVNNFVLTMVATIPINMEYDAWLAIIGPHNQSDMEPLLLYDHLNRQSWFLCIELVTKTKCLLVTTKSNLLEARDWIDANLERLVRKSIPPEVNPSSSFLLRRLDKPVYTKMSQTYADIFKKQFLLTLTPTTTETDNNRPPRKWQAKILDYASDQATNPPTTATNFTSSSTSSHCHPAPQKLP